MTVSPSPADSVTDTCEKRGSFTAITLYPAAVSLHAHRSRQQRPDPQCLGQHQGLPRLHAGLPEDVRLLYHTLQLDSQQSSAFRRGTLDALSEGGFVICACRQCLEPRLPFVTSE